MKRKDNTTNACIPIKTKTSCAKTIVVDTSYLNCCYYESSTHPSSKRGFPGLTNAMDEDVMSKENTEMVDEEMKDDRPPPRLMITKMVRKELFLCLTV